MGWSVRDGRTGIGAALACLPRLHSHFVTEWKPDLPYRSEIGNRLSEGTMRSFEMLERPLRVRRMRGALGRGSAAYVLLIVSQATPAVLLCTAARDCLFRGKILRD